MAHDSDSIERLRLADPVALAKRVAELEARVAFLEQKLNDALGELSRILVDDLALV